MVLAPDGTFTNELGMKFVDVPGTDVLMCIHETRHKDYEAYAADVPGAIAIWSNGVERGLDPMVSDRGNHPVIRVTWQEAQSFCAWLSKKEHRVYRLPTDREWSFAVGLGDEEKWTTETTPAGIAKNTTVFPWGPEWPPPPGTGNFSDAARKRGATTSEFFFIDYDDGFFTTAPVMSFKPNKLGIFDLGGNLSEWVEDWWDGRRKTHALRGSSWTDAKRENLLSSSRLDGTYAEMNPAVGFRCVLERRPTFHADPPLIVEKPRQSKFPKTMKPGQVAKAGLTNSLGMKFVPIPGTDVFFCIHETRRKDYAAFDHEVPQTGAGLQWKQPRWGSEPTGMGEDHPVSGVSWNEAQDFCTWLSRKEERLYRLPTDAEWSIAVGIGDLEILTGDSTPDMLGGIGPGSFPYGAFYPPTTDLRAGNYADLTHRKAFPTADILDKYDDGFITSAPVMSFNPNPLGLYDLGGNVSEWTESWSNARQSHKILRGGSWEDFTIDCLRSGKRFSVLPVIHRASYGFRCVLESDLPDPNLPPPRKFPEPLPEAEVKARSVMNSLGMKFVPVPGAEVLFCIHETRRQDYAAFSTSLDIDNDYKISYDYMLQNNDGKPVAAEDDHPAVALNWDDANAFCAWLSQREDRRYRLPTDREWSIAVGLGPYEPPNKPWEQINEADGKEFPFGNIFPPRGKAGNYADETYRRTFLTSSSISGYDDGCATTAPVMSFKPNPFGLYDLGGNVSEWCDDVSNPKDMMRVQRGGSWKSQSVAELYAAKRITKPRSTRHNVMGFRCVLVPGGKPQPLPEKQSRDPGMLPEPIPPKHIHAVSGVQAQSPPKYRESMTLDEAEQQAITNSLGMKLLPVAGTSVFFCIHETRFKDYAAYGANMVLALDEPWRFQKMNGVVIDDNENHPVCSVSRQEAQAFCAWLSQKEGRTYRLPTDREWSYAAGIGPRETWTKDTTPQTVFKVLNHFPWEGTWPPPPGSGNLFDETRHAKGPQPDSPYITGYDDGYVTTSPVMKFKPNQRGLYDMSGNVWEWCEDPFDQARCFFPLRGGSWAIPGSGWIQSSFRYPRLYNSRSPALGFRIVLEP